MSAARTTATRIRVARQLRKIDADKLDGLSATQLRRVGRLLVREGDAGTRLVDELDATTLRRLADSDADLDRVVRNYDRLPAYHQNRFVQLIADDDLGESWLRVVGDEEIGAVAVRDAIDNVDEISEFGRIDTFRTGRRVNEIEYPPHYEPVHSPDSIVIEFTLRERTTFYRLWPEGTDGKVNRFLLREKTDITELTPKRIQPKYSIPGEPPYMVARAEIPEGIPMRTGRVATNEFGSGGGIQFVIPESRVPKNDLKRSWFRESESLTDELRAN